MLNVYVGQKSGRDVDRMMNDVSEENESESVIRLMEAQYGEDAPDAALYMASLLTEFAAYSLAPKQSAAMTANLVMISASLMKASARHEDLVSDLSHIVIDLLNAPRAVRPTD